MSENKQQEELDKLADDINEVLAQFLARATELAQKYNKGPLNLYNGKLITQAEFLERLCRFMRRPFVKQQYS